MVPALFMLLFLSSVGLLAGLGTAVPPDVLISYPLDGSTYRASETIELNASASYDPDGKDITVHWKSNVDGDLGYGAVRKVKLSTGGHIITCEVEDDDREKAEATRQVTILPLEAPIAKLEANRTEVEIFQQIMFSGDKSVDPDFDVVAYRFIFDDGHDSGWINGSQMSHSFNYPGTYTVRLEVRDNDGLTDSTEITITVRNRSSSHDTTDDARKAWILLLAIIVIIVIIGAVAARRMAKNRRREEEEALRRRLKRRSGAKRKARSASSRRKGTAHKVLQPRRKARK
jgi:hypothetical protein